MEYLQRELNYLPKVGGFFLKSFSVCGICNEYFQKLLYSPDIFVQEKPLKEESCEY